MRNKLKSTNKIICLFLLVLCCFFAACKDSNDDDNANDNDYVIIDLGEVNKLTFSHNSGLYDRKFKLTIAAQAGNEIYYSTEALGCLQEQVSESAADGLEA